MTPAIVAAKARRARFMALLQKRASGFGIRDEEGGISWTESQIPDPKALDCRSHFAVPILRFGIHRSEDFHVPFAAAPGFDHLGRDDVDEDFGEQAAFRIALEVVRG